MNYFFLDCKYSIAIKYEQTVNKVLNIGECYKIIVVVKNYLCEMHKNDLVLSE